MANKGKSEPGKTGSATSHDLVADSASEAGPIVIKKYANRRLYNTASSAYVTLDDLCELVKQGHDFLVYDAKSGDDITRSVLTQIIFEEEAKGHNLLPVRFLQQLIRFYDDSLQGVVPRYLEVSMENLEKNQAQWKKGVEDALSGLSGGTNWEGWDNKKTGPRGPLEEIARQNFALIDKAIRTLTGLGPKEEETGLEEVAEAAAEVEGDEISDEDAQIEELKAQLAAMQSQIDALSKK